jgi:hypothetical protein
MVEHGMPGGTADSLGRRLFADLLERVKHVVTPDLAYVARDKDGRTAMDVASKPVKHAIQEMLLWHGRYRVTDPQPEHASATCFVFKAIDDRNKQVRVAAKLMRHKAQYEREFTARDKGFSAEYVMELMETCTAPGTERFQNAAEEVKDVEADATGQVHNALSRPLFILYLGPLSRPPI